MQETDNGDLETFEHRHGKVAAICALPEATNAWFNTRASMLAGAKAPTLQPRAMTLSVWRMRRDGTVLWCDPVSRHSFGWHRGLCCRVTCI